MISSHSPYQTLSKKTASMIFRWS